MRALSRTTGRRTSRSAWRRGDFDGDGADEVLFRHASDGSRPVASPGGAEADVTAGLPAGADHRAAGVGDFDGDGMDEVMLRHGVEGTWHP